MPRIVVISHALVQKSSRRRWELLQNSSDWDVHIIIPKKWISKWFGPKQSLGEANNSDVDGLSIHRLPTSSRLNWKRYLFLSVDLHFRAIRPDLIYVIQDEMSLVFQQIIVCKKLFAKSAKMCFFSMRGMPDVDLLQCSSAVKTVYLISLIKNFFWNNIRTSCCAGLVHYPGGVISLRAMGFERPIFIQTQIGVDMSLFEQNQEVRQIVRKQFGLEEKNVLGFVGRVDEIKGILTIATAMSYLTEEYALLVVGDGPASEKLREMSLAKGWDDRLVTTGFVDQVEVPRYINAMDCVIVASQTTESWIDTFPLITAQAFSVGIPVIGSTSGGIPWHLGEAGFSFKEGDAVDLVEKVRKLFSSKQLRSKLSKLGWQRANEIYSTHSLAKNFELICEQICSGDYERNMTFHDSIQWKAFISDTKHNEIF